MEYRNRDYSIYGNKRRVKIDPSQDEMHIYNLVDDSYDTYHERYDRYTYGAEPTNIGLRTPQNEVTFIKLFKKNRYFIVEWACRKLKLI